MSIAVETGFTTEEYSFVFEVINDKAINVTPG